MTSSPTSAVRRVMSPCIGICKLDQNVLTGLTEDYREGTAACREKRKPWFKGR